MAQSSTLNAMIPRETTTHLANAQQELMKAVSSLGDSLKKYTVRRWYDTLARRYPATQWTFINYGYHDASVPPLELEAEDEPDRYFIQLYNRVAGAVDLTGRDVLEVGCGRGGGSSFIARYRQPATVIGLDLGHDAVSFCRKTHRAPGLSFEQGDAENLPFENDSFDAVVNVESSSHYPSFEKFLGEVHRVLRKDGHFLYTDFREKSAISSWRRSLNESGLELVEEDDITAKVVAALDADNDRKIEFFDEVMDRSLRRWTHYVGAFKGSTLYEALRSHKLVYRAFVLRKNQ